MHARLMAFLLPVLGLGAIVGVIVLGQQTTLAMNRGEQLARQADFAGLVEAVEAAVAFGDPSTFDHPTDLERAVVVRAGDESVVLPSRDALRAGVLDRPRMGGDELIWPWTDGEVEFVETVGGLDVIALYSTDPLQGTLTRRWLILVAAVGSAFGLLAAGLYPMTKWALRPVRQLDAAASSIAEGDLAVRAPTPKGAPELRQLGETFNLMAEKVAKSVHRERAFVANASHHLGNLMTPLRIRVESLQGQGDSVEEALVELDRLEAVVERLLELNHAEDHDAQVIVVDVGSVVDQCVGTWQAAAEFESVEMTRHGPSEATALAVPGAVAEIVDNLIDNALKYGEGTPISVSVVRGLSNVRIVVADHGPGMTDEEMQQAHGRFWRSKSQQNRPGSGLGLAIVDALAQRCGGHVDLRNAPDGGFEVSVVLKRAPSAKLQE